MWDTCGRGYKERGEKGECKAPFVSGATINSEWSTVLGKAPEGGKKGPGKRPHMADTELITRTDLRCQPLQLPDTALDHNSQKWPFLCSFVKKQQKWKPCCTATKWNSASYKCMNEITYTVYTPSCIVMNGEIKNKQINKNKTTARLCSRQFIFLLSGH